MIKRKRRRKNKPRRLTPLGTIKLMKILKDIAELPDYDRTTLLRVLLRAGD